MRRPTLPNIPAVFKQFGLAFFGKNLALYNWLGFRAAKSDDCHSQHVPSVRKNDD